MGFPMMKYQLLTYILFYQLLVLLHAVSNYY